MIETTFIPYCWRKLTSFKLRPTREDAWSTVKSIKCKSLKGKDSRILSVKGLSMFDPFVFPLKLSINLFSIERERFFSFLDKIIIANINRVTINPTPDATFNIWTITGIRILAQRSIFIAIRETNGPRLYLLSFHNFWNSGEWFFFIMMAQRKGNITARIIDKLNKAPLIPDMFSRIIGFI